MRAFITTLIVLTLLLLAGCVHEEPVQEPESTSSAVLEHDPVLEALAAHVDAMDALDPTLPGADEELALLQAELEDRLGEQLSEELLPWRGRYEPSVDLDFLRQVEPEPMGSWTCLSAFVAAGMTTSTANITWTYANLEVAATGGNPYAIKARTYASWAAFWADMGLGYAEMAFVEDPGYGTWVAVYMELAWTYSDRAWFNALVSGGPHYQTVMDSAETTAELAESARDLSLVCAD